MRDDQEPCSTAAAELIVPFMDAQPWALNWDGPDLNLRASVAGHQCSMCFLRVNQYIIATQQTSSS